MEKMPAHELVVAHKNAMEQIDRAHGACGPEIEIKRLAVTDSLMKVYQRGLLTLKTLRQNESQRILVQYVNVSECGQAMIGNAGQGSTKASCIARYQAESPDRQSSRTRSPPSVVARTAGIP